MTHKFNVGDKVKLTYNHDTIGVITHLNGTLRVCVHFKLHEVWHDTRNLELVSRRELMKTNTTAIDIAINALAHLGHFTQRMKAEHIVDALISHGIIEEDKPWWRVDDVKAWMLCGSGKVYTASTMSTRSVYAAQGNLFRTESEAIAEQDRRAAAVSND